MTGRYKEYPEYKESGVEWLENIPTHWSSKALKFLCTYNDEVINETTDPETIIEYVDIGSVSAVEGISKTEKIAFGKSPSRARRIVSKGDVIVSTVRTYLEAIAPITNPPENMIVSTGFAVIRPNSKLDKRFAAYCLRAKGFIREVVARSVGISYPAINATELVGISVPYLPYEEQQKIANFLDHETAKIDTLIAKQEKLIELLKEKRQAVISHAVTKGLNPEASMKDSGVEWLGEVPEHWDVMELKFSAKKGYKTFTDGDWIESPYITDTGVRLLQTGNVGTGFFKEQGFRYISDSSYHKLNCTEVKPNDVLICRLDGPVGRSCLAPDLGVKVITSVDNAILKPSDNFDPRFIVYATNSESWINWIQDLCRVGGGFRLRISRTMLGEQKIPCPPLNHQKNIADMLDNLSDLVNESILKSNKSIALLKERKTALISAAVTGKIDVRDWQEQTEQQG
ncbi:restriction endonuclease subunit S [Marinomonas mediterranea]|uniref:restriction endonuclease subunit S n=1 Tax=Marinomonas mediterranea TaxID=119864 RepID=UPI0023491F37|nr:restriction endonuclease subunit S [Marinomonas mediterranea]WCN12930.1 restriction endonuclease subunit S [Marinomonas mediterranea]